MTKQDKRNLTKGKSGCFFYQRRYKGNRYYFSLQTKDWNEAMRLRDQYNYELQKYGTFLNETEEQVDVIPVFGKLCEEWYEDKKIDPDIREDTLDNYRNILNAHFLQTPFVNKRIDKIKTYEFSDWWKKELKKNTKGLKGSTINFYLGILNNVFNYALGRYLDYNPVKGMKKPKNDPEEIFPFERHEVVSILKKAKEQEERFSGCMESIYDYIVVKIFTGLRISEIIALETRKHIDLKKGIIKVRQGIVKGKLGSPKTDTSKRDVNMCPIVKDAIKRQMERSIKKGTTYLFFNHYGNPICTNNFRTSIWKPLMDMLEIDYRPFEQTRHTYASLLLDEGEKVSYISKQMGHSNIYITLTIYAKWIPSEDDGEILTKVTEKLQSSILSEISDSVNNLESQEILI